MFLTSSVRRAALALAVLAMPAALQAQNKFEFTPWIGSYFAMTDFYNDDFDLTNIGGTGTTNITVNQENTAMFGLRASIPVGATLAAEGSFGFARSNARLVIKDAFGGLDGATTGKSNVIIGSLRAVMGSIEVSAKCNAATQMTEQYQIDAPAQIAVGGRYVTGPAMLGGAARVAPVLDALLTLVKQQRD